MARIFKTDERGSAIARMPGLLAMIAVASVVGLVIAADFGPSPQQGVVAIDIGTLPAPTVEPTTTEMVPSGGDSQPLDPELLRTDRANEHHG